REKTAYEMGQCLEFRRVLFRSAAARAGLTFSDQPLTGACACLLGGEGSGLTDDLLRAADGLITIPMQPPVESLNVAVSAALIVRSEERRVGRESGRRRGR